MVSETTGTTPPTPETTVADRQASVRTSFNNAIARERSIAFSNDEIIGNVREEKAYDAGIAAVLKTLDQLKAQVSFKHSEAAVTTSGEFADSFFASVNS